MEQRKLKTNTCVHIGWVDSLKKAWKQFVLNLSNISNCLYYADSLDKINIALNIATKKHIRINLVGNHKTHFFIYLIDNAIIDNF